VTGHGYLAGLVWLAATFGLLALATAALLRRRLGALEGAPRAVAAAVVFTAGLVGAHVVPLALGVLSRGTVLAVAGAALVVVLSLGARPAAAAAPPTATAAAGPLGAAAVAVVAAAWIVAMARDAAHPVLALDASTFHLPNVARWIQHGTLWRIDQFLPGLAQGNYPQNGDVVTLAAVLPWRDAFPARLMMGAFYAATGLSIYALAREAGAQASGAALAGALVLAVPIVAVAALHNAMPDPVMYAMFAAGLLFLLRHARGGATADLVLAGIALGLAFGAKWYAVSAVAAVLAVWGAARLLGGEGLGRVARDGALLAGLVGLAGGVWLVRNLVESGNPAFPQKVAPLGVTLFDAPPDPIRELAGFTVADYLGSPGVWRDFLVPSYRHFLAAPAALLLAGLLAVAGVAGVALVRRRRRLDGRIVALSVLALVLVAAYAATPYSAFGPRDQPFFAGQNSRYVVPALIVAAAVGAWAVERLGRARIAAEALAAVAVVLGVRRGFAGVSAPGVAAVAGALLGAWWAVRARGLPRNGLALAGAAALVLAAVAGARLKHRFDARGYHGSDPTIDWVLTRAPSGARIGLAGVFEPSAAAPVLPVFGPQLGNDVRYVGPWVRRRLEQYRSAPPFRAELRAGGYDLLLVGRGAPPRDLVAPERWAMAAGWTPVARSGAMTLLRAPRRG
jgi:hypothetical protein